MKKLLAGLIALILLVALQSEASVDALHYGALTAEAPADRIFSGPCSQSYFLLKSDGSLWARGRNDSGQLGDGSTTAKSNNTYSQPEEAEFGVKILEDVQAASGGASHTLILKKDGSLWACGDNQYGQLGDGTTVQRLTPVKIMEECSPSARADGIPWPSRRTAAFGHGA